MNNGTFLLIEGISNTGKTSLCQELASKHNYKVIQESIRYLENRTNLPETDIMSTPESIYQEVLNQELLFDTEFQKIFDANLLIKGGQNVVLDKSFISILATAYAFELEKNFAGGVKAALDHLFSYCEKINRFHLKMPDKIVLLTVNQSAFSTRNKQRNHVLSDVWIDPRITIQQELFLKMIVPLFRIPYIEIDTSNLSKSDIKNLVLDFIEQ